MKKLILMIAAVAMATTALARPLTPAEALERAATSGSQPARKVVDACRMSRLVMTVMRGGESAVYVFNRTDGQGFLVLPADDIAAPVLGYSDVRSIELDSVPANFRAWLEGYADQISRAVSSGVEPRDVIRFSPTTRHEIAPLTKTLWNQDDPYNSMCPVVDGKHCVTGCVATAMAQVMKVHEWPARGTGSVSYAWNEQTLSMDFSSTAFDWSSMLNSYTGASSREERDAVATLMKACGYATEMDYSVDGSGTTSYHAGLAYVNYFGYDKSVRVLERDCYSLTEWTDMVYNELAEGRPVQYGGTSSMGGHSFVCDGYRTDGYFHFNWGWGGTSNGYFLLTALNPIDQGIGGSGAGFNDGQDIIVGVQRPQPGSRLAVTFMLTGNFDTYETTYARSSMVGFVPSGGSQNGIFNMSLGNVEAEMGVKLTDANGNSSYISSGESHDFAFSAGLSGYYVSGSAFPSSGTYTVTPAVYSDGEWYDVESPITGVSTLKLVANGGTLIFSQIPVEVNLTASALSTSTPLYAGNNCEVRATIANNGNAEFYGTVYPVLITTEYGYAEIAGQGAGQKLDIEAGQSVEMEAIVNFGVPAGNYIYAVVTVSDNEAQIIGETLNVTVEVPPAGIEDVAAEGLRVEFPDEETLRVVSADEVMYVEVYDLTGRRLLRVDGDNSPALTVALDGIPGGVLVVKAVGKSETVVKRMIK